MLKSCVSKTLEVDRSKHEGKHCLVDRSKHEGSYCFVDQSKHEGNHCPVEACGSKQACSSSICQKSANHSFRSVMWFEQPEPYFEFDLLSATTPFDLLCPFKQFPLPPFFDCATFEKSWGIWEGKFWGTTVGSREDSVIHVILIVSIFCGGDNINDIDSRAMLGHGCSYDVGSLRGIEFNLLFLDQILHLVLQSPSVVGIMARTFRVVNTLSVWTVTRRYGVGVLRSLPQSYQIGLQ